MKKNPIRFFSLMFAVIMTLSVTAAPHSRRANQARSNQSVVSTPAAPAPTVDPRDMLQRPKKPVNTGIKSTFATSAKVTDFNIRTKAPRNLAGAAKAAGLPNLLGSVIYSDDFSMNGAGLFTIPTNSSQEFERLFLYANAEYGGVLVGDTYFTCENYYYPWGGSNISYTGYDISTGKDYFEAKGVYYTYSMTYDLTTSTVYAIANYQGLNALVTVKFDTAQKTVEIEPIAAIGMVTDGIWNAIACDSKGQLWAVYSDAADPEMTGGEFVCTGSTLYKIDKTTGVATKVGETGYDSLYASDAIFDTKTDRMYWTVFNSAMEGFLTEIDTTTGAATIIYDFPANEQVTGLAIPEPEAEDKAPASVTDLVANFSKDSLTGTVGFKTPTTFYDGTDGTGNINYTVTANGQEVATGTTTFDTEVSADVTVQAAGFYTFVVSTNNDAGESPKVETKTYVGADTPESTKVTATYLDGVMTISWLPVTASINGGFIDVDNINYKVTRFPGNKVIAENTTATSVTENLPEPDRLTAYYYDVVATSGTLSSAPARSNTVTLGYITPPYSATFEGSLDGFSVIDANGDGITWIENDGNVRIMYNETMDMDDWLISPALKLKAGQLYNIAAQFACGRSDLPEHERIEVKAGQASSPEAMTTVLLEPTEVTNKLDDPMEWNGAFVPDADGNYYIGFHGISKMDVFLLYIENFSITPSKTGDGPVAVTDLTVIPDESGALTAAISFTTPSKTLTGKDLDALTKVELRRGRQIIKTWEAPAINTQLTYVDNLTSPGEYTYSVVSYSSAGNGPEAVVSTYVGVDYPASVVNVKAFETDKPGEVTITWDAVTTTAEGAPLDPSLVKYQVYIIKDGSPVPLSGILTTTTYTYQAVAQGQQTFVQYIVAAITDRGTSNLINASLSGNIPTGTPYHGIYLSGDSDLKKYIVGMNTAGGAEWGVYDDTLIPSQDYDNRMFALYGPYINCYGNLYTGLISLEGFSNPGISFYTYNISDVSDTEPDLNEIVVGVRVNGTLEFVTAKTIIVSETGLPSRWNRVIVDLSEYAGKTIQVNFYSIIKSIAYTIIDNIYIGNIYTHDLSIMSISAPDEVATGSSVSIDVVVSNDGTAAAEGYTVELYTGDELVATKTGNAIEGGDNTVVKFDVTMPPFATRDVEYTAKVVLAGDENAANDRSETIAIATIPSKLPAVTNLNGSLVDAAVTLTWDEPDVASIPADAITDDFEDAMAFIPYYGMWKFVDMDNSPVSGFSDMDLPNIIAGMTKGSFWIWDTDTRGTGNSYFKAHSGTKYLFALYREDQGLSDEWAISPELDGSAQTISFYAQSYLPQYLEKIKIWYSSTTSNPEDFTLITTIDQVGYPWTRYEFDVPAGAKYFAINSCAKNAFMLMVDDVTYIPAGAPHSTKFEGYNVYRNGAKINDNVIMSREYIDNDVEDGQNYEYVVVAVYNKGQSLPSNVVSILYQGTDINDICDDTLSIATDKGAIVVRGAESQQIAIHAIDGKTVFEGLGEDTTVIPVQPGVYVVKAGQTVAKVFVK